MAFIEDEQMIQALLSHAAHPPLGIGIGVWSPIRCQDHFYTLRDKHGIKTCGKLRITIVKEKTHLFPFLLEFPHELASLLRHPSCRRVRGTSSQMNATRPKLDEEEHLERLQPQRFYGEEITGQQLLLMLAKESTPGTALLGAQG